MSETQPCPPPQRLADFLNGKVVDPDLSAFAEHLEGCSKCQAQARTLSPFDTLTDSLRGDAPQADEIASAVPRPLVERLKHIPQAHSRDGLGRPADEDLSFLEPAQQTDEIGRLGTFRVLKILGQGGMGTVFLAEDQRLNRLAALKVMSPKIAAHPTARARFIREARAAAGLNSDHIVKLFLVDENNGIPYMAMELLEGESLADLVAKGEQLPIADCVCIARGIADGLAHAHGKGLIHRDIKPGNLWVERTSAGGIRAKILDFGLAWQHDEVQLTHLGAIVGTPAFMSPEQARHDKQIDGRADLFSLGCVLYLLTTGQLPFAAETTMGTLMSLAMDDPLPPAQLNPRVPAKLSQLIMQLLEKDPNDRPPSAKEVGERLAEIERSLPSGKEEAAESKPALRSPATIAGVCLAMVAAAIGIFNLPGPEEADNKNVPRVGGNELPPGPSEQATDPDRRAADWILSIGGKVEIDGGPWIDNVDSLPAGSFAVTQISLAANKSYTDEGFAHCEGLKQLTIIHFDSTKVGDAGLEHLRESTHLAELYFFDANISDAGLAHLRNMKELQVLALGSCPRVTDKGLVHLHGLENLTRLYLDGTQVTDASLLWLKTLKNLQTLDLGVLNVSQAGILQLKDFPALTSLCLRGTPTTDETLRQFKNLKLTSLNLDGTQITDEGLEILTGHPLAKLYVRNNKVSTEALTKFHAALPGCQLFYDGGIFQPD